MEDRWDTGRTEAFSDGVFAIAITLLILEVSVPHSEFGNLWRGIAHQWPSYLAYATSFITIGAIWLVHHGIFRRLQYANSWVMRINLGLGVIVLAIFAPRVAAFGFLVISIVVVLHAHGDQGTPPEIAAHPR
jgi:uncharacterized membrane protein